MFTVVITFKNTCPFRYKNFKFLTNVLELEQIPFVVMEQIDHSDEEKESVSYCKNFTYVKVPLKGHFKKSLLINKSINFCRTDYILFLDSDVVLPFGHIQKFLNENPNSGVIKPFKQIHLLEKTSTQRFVKGLETSLHNVKKSNAFGKHAILIKKEIFKSVKGFDESFEGWGWEDLDFVNNRLPNRSHDIINSVAGVHMYHPKSSRILERINYVKYKENGDRRILTSFLLDFKNNPITEENFIALLNLIKQFLGKANLILLNESKCTFKFKKYLNDFPRNHKNSILFYNFKYASGKKDYKNIINTIFHFIEGACLCPIFPETVLSKDLIQKIINKSSRLNQNFEDKKNHIISLSKLNIDFNEGIPYENFDYNYENFLKLSHDIKQAPINHKVNHNYGLDIDDCMIYNSTRQAFQYF